MKIKISIDNFIKEQKESSKKCVDFLGTGNYSVKNLENIVKALENCNNAMRSNCTTTTTIKTKTCGGTYCEIDEPIITQSKLYQDNQNLIFSVKSIIDIAKSNNMEHITNFDFTNDQLLNYAQQK